MLRRLNGRPRRILMTVDAVGGVWEYAVRLAQELVSGGDTVLMAGLGPEPSSDQAAQVESFAGLVWLRTVPDWMAGREADLDGFEAELAPLLRDHAIDLVHLNAPAQAAGLQISQPLLVVSHSCVPTWFHAVKGEPVPADWAWHRERNRKGFDRADLVVAPSASHAATLSACYGDLPRLSVVYNAVPEASSVEHRDDIAFAAARWWDEGKNGAALDEAAAATQWPVVAAGPTNGPNGQSLAFGNAMALGPLPNDEVRGLMAKCLLFVSPSVYEPFGLAALEAASAGTPLVLADIPTYRELWEGAALFFPPRDASELAAVVDEVMQNRGLQDGLGRAARLRSHDFTTKRQADAMRAAYERAFSIFTEGRR